MPTERSYQCALPLSRDSVLVTGGYSWNSVLGRTDRLNLTSSPGPGWSSLPGLGTPRYLHACSPLPLPSGKAAVTNIDLRSPPVSESPNKIE